MADAYASYAQAPLRRKVIIGLECAYHFLNGRSF